MTALHFWDLSSSRRQLNLAILFFQCSSSAFGPTESLSFLIWSHSARTWKLKNWTEWLKILLINSVLYKPNIKLNIRQKFIKGNSRSFCSFPEIIFLVASLVSLHFLNYCPMYWFEMKEDGLCYLFIKGATPPTFRKNVMVILWNVICFSHEVLLIRLVLTLKPMFDLQYLNRVQWKF